MVAIKVLQKRAAKIKGLIDPTGELKAYPLDQDFPIFGEAPQDSGQGFKRD